MNQPKKSITEKTLAETFDDYVKHMGPLREDFYQSIDKMVESFGQREVSNPQIFGASDALREMVTHFKRMNSILDIMPINLAMKFSFFTSLAETLFHEFIYTGEDYPGLAMEVMEVMNNK